MGLISELRRRNVLRMAVLYAIAAWLIMQVVEVMMSVVGLPTWAGRATFAVLAVGFPIALIFSWFFEITPEGISLEKDVDRAESITYITGRRLDVIVISLLCAAVILFAYDKWWIGPPPERSIAVLPFENMSSDPGQAFFAKGIHDDLLTTLAKIGTLKVISRTSVMRYEDSKKSIPEIARELGVATLLEGGIQHSADQVRINVQLIDAQTDEHLWAENYDRKLTAENLFTIQSEIVHEIVGALQVVLTDEESERLQAMPTTSLEAYGEFVMGRQENAERTADALYRAQARFEKAIELDPDYTLAYVGLADSLALQVEYGNLNRGDSFAPRQAAIDRALELDPLSGEAYSSLALLRWRELKDDEAEEYFLHAIELSPNYATAYHWYSLFLSNSSRYEEALPHIRRAVELDPMAPILNGALAGTLYTLGRVEESHATLLKGVERNPQFAQSYRNMAQMMLRQGRVAEAMKWARAATRIAPSTVAFKTYECYLYLHLGDDQSAERCFDSAEAASHEGAFGPKADLYLFRSEFQEAVDLMEQLAQREPDSFGLLSLAAAYFINGEADKAMPIWQDLEPELLFDEDLIIKPRQLWKAFVVADTFYVDGQLDRANYLFDQMLETMQSMHRIRGPGYQVWDVYIHTARGEKQMAISALREAIDAGWRTEWWELRFPYFDSMRDEPEWINLINELEVDIARQRKWYEEHKDDPLF